MKQTRVNTGMLHFDQDHVNCSGCLHLKFAVYDMGGQRVWNQGEGYFLCSATHPPFLQSFPSIKGFNQQAHIVFLLYEPIFSEIS